VEKALEPEPRRAVADLVEDVHTALGRRNISDVDVRRALEQIPCGGLLAKLRRQLTAGKVQYQEKALLEELLRAVSERTRQGLGVARARPLQSQYSVAVADRPWGRRRPAGIGGAGRPRILAAFGRRGAGVPPARPGAISWRFRSQGTLQPP